MYLDHRKELVRLCHLINSKKGKSHREQLEIENKIRLRAVLLDSKLSVSDDFYSLAD